VLNPRLLHTELTEEMFFSTQEGVRVQLHPPMWGPDRVGIPHTHDFFELIYVYQGAFKQVIDGREITQTDDELVLLRPGAWHHTWSEQESDLVFNILLSKAAVKRSLLRLVSPKNPLYRFLFEGAVEKAEAANYLLFTHTGSQRDILDTLVAEYYDQNPGYAQVILAQLVLLFAGLARETYQRPDTGGYLADDILAYISHHYPTVTQSTLAEQFNYSPRHLGRVLKAATGKTFPQLVNAHKIDAVCEKLVTTNAPIGEIVAECGFCSANYFYEVFRRERGVPFATFRAK
jgi:AraC-like DNA-binding protein